MSKTKNSLSGNQREEDTLPPHGAHTLGKVSSITSWAQCPPVRDPRQPGAGEGLQQARGSSPCLVICGASEAVLFPQEGRSGAGMARRWIPGASCRSRCTGRGPLACCGSSRRWASSVLRCVLCTGWLVSMGPLQSPLSAPWRPHGRPKALTLPTFTLVPHLCS